MGKTRDCLVNAIEEAQHRGETIDVSVNQWLWKVEEIESKV